MSTADAVDREVAWLTAVDDLPSLLTVNGGPWDVVQAYWARTPGMQKTRIFVTRARIRDVRVANQRKRPGYGFRLRLVWPIGASTTGAAIAEVEQRALDAAVELLIERIRDHVGNKSHGGRFLSAGETPGSNPEIDVDFDPPEQTLANGELTATVTYSVDDTEVVI